MTASYAVSRAASPATPVGDGKVGNRKKLIRTITLSGTYVTGGDPLLPSAFGLRWIDDLSFQNGSVTDGTVQYPATWIQSNGKLKLWESGGAAGTAAAEKGNGESLTGITGVATIVGY